MRHLTIGSLIIIILSSYGFISKGVLIDNSRPISTAVVDTSRMNEILSIEEKHVVHTNDFIDFAKSFLGTPYVWGSVNPKVGFDCSGFVNHVSKHFGFDVPRTSAQFLRLGSDVEPEDAQAGDIILFSGNNLKTKKVVHMGIVIENTNGELQFIHSSRGGKKGVNITGMTNYFQLRLVRIVRIFPFAEDEMVG